MAAWSLWPLRNSSALAMELHLSCTNPSIIGSGLNTLRPRQNDRHFPGDIFRWIFLNENVWFSINISLKFVPRGPINNIPTLVQKMAWRRPGDKPLSEPMMFKLSCIYASLGLNELRLAPVQSSSDRDTIINTEWKLIADGYWWRLCMQWILWDLI